MKQNRSFARKAGASVFLLIITVAASLAFREPDTKKYNVSLTAEGWQYVLSVLETRPKKEVDPLYNDMVTQLQRQVSADTTKPSPKK
jgi:hypothetical protein